MSKLELFIDKLYDWFDIGCLFINPYGFNLRNIFSPVIDRNWPDRCVPSSSVVFALQDKVLPATNQRAAVLVIKNYFPCLTA